MFHQDTQYQFNQLIQPANPDSSSSNPSDSLSSQMTCSSSPRNSANTERDAHATSKKKRPISNYFKQQGSSINLVSDKSSILQQVQLSLIQEVNNDTRSKQESQIFPRENIAGVRTSLVKYNQMDESDPKKTRAQRVPVTEKMSPFNVFQSFKSSSQVQECAQKSQNQIEYYDTREQNHNIINAQKDMIALQQNFDNAQSWQQPQNFMSLVSPKYNGISQELSNYNSAPSLHTVKSPSIQRSNRKFDLNTDSSQSNGSAPLVPVNEISRPSSVPQQIERQIKYLGLVIEKDDEHVLQLDDLDLIERCGYRLSDFDQSLTYSDNTRREYKPIRDRYIKIVKNSRKLSIESFEKRGRKDFKATTKALQRIAKATRRANFEQSIERQLSGMSLH